MSLMSMNPHFGGPPHFETFEEEFSNAFASIQEVAEKYPSIMEKMEEIEALISIVHSDAAQDAAERDT